MTIITLSATQDHLEKVARTSDAIKALSEFVWNALDADATKVDVEFVRNPLGGIQDILVRDNGSGINIEHAEADFRNLGNSWKRDTRRTTKKRPMHGKEGKGRLQFFSIAEVAKWQSSYRDGDGIKGLEIEIASLALDKAKIDSVDKSGVTQTGTLVVLSNLKESFDWLLSQETIVEFTSRFAAYLMQYRDVTITYNGQSIDPSITVLTSIDLPTKPLVFATRTVEDISIKVIEWTSRIESRKIHLGGDTGIVLGSQSANVTAPGFDFSAYANSSFFEEMANRNLLELDDLSDPDFKEVMKYVREQITDYFRRRQAEKSKGLIDELRNEGAYPYEGEPLNEVERRERQVFDIATYTVSSYSKEFKKADSSIKRMTLTLLKEALRNNPETLRSILQAVINLPKARQDEFSALLQKTELSNIISASSLIAGRVTVLKTLGEIAFNPKHRSTIKERGELDAIVRDNSWIFGEYFHITLHEAGLTKVMDRVATELQLNKRKTRSAIKKANGQSGRIDCFLGRSVPHADVNKREYIVVELKRPSLKIGRKELDQLEDYVKALKSQPEYVHTDTNWNFYLVTGEYHEEIEDRINQENRPKGLFIDTSTSKVWVKTWSELIRECEGRLNFVQDKLKIEISDEAIEREIVKLKGAILKESEIDATSSDQLNNHAAGAPSLEPAE